MRCVLKWMGWEKRKSLFLDAWKVWISWAISSLIMLVVFLVIDHNYYLANYRALLTLSITVVLSTADVLVVGAVLKQMALFNRQVSISISEIETPFAQLSLPIWKTSFLLCFAATLTIASVLGIMALVGNIYDRIYPPPAVQFGIYDI